MTEAEQEELDALNGFLELLGVSEMTDEQWERWKELNKKSLTGCIPIRGGNE